MRTNNGFILRNVYGKALLMPVRCNEVGDDPIFLNSVASVIWELAFENNSFERTVSVINELYGLEEGSVEEEAVKQFIIEMINMKLIFDD